MKTEDRGEFDGPALLFGGPVGDLQALEAAPAQGRTSGGRAARTVGAGDPEACCRRPVRTAERAREAGLPPHDGAPRTEHVIPEAGGRPSEDMPPEALRRASTA